MLHTGTAGQGQKAAESRCTEHRGPSAWGWQRGEEGDRSSGRRQGRARAGLRIWLASSEPTWSGCMAEAKRAVRDAGSLGAQESVEGRDKQGSS